MRKQLTQFMFSILLLGRAVAALTPEAAENVPFYHIPSTIKYADREIERLNKNIQTKPRLEDSIQFKAFGFHSDYLPVLSEIPDQPRWTLDLTFETYTGIEELFLVPTMERRIGRNYNKNAPYGFPSHFRVSQVFPDGRIQPVYEHNGKPHLSRMPLFIAFPEPRSSSVRLEIFKGAVEENREFFALEEIYATSFSYIRRAQSVKVSSAIESPPFWGLNYLFDQQTNLGQPLGPKNPSLSPKQQKDFSANFGHTPPGCAEIEIDFGENRPFGWLILYPALWPEGILIPGYGFPGKISGTIIPENQDGLRGSSSEIENWTGGSPGNNPVRLHGKGHIGRWLKLKLSDFPQHNGDYIFAMGEIRMYGNGRLYPVSGIRLEGFPKTEFADHMFDGYVGGQPVLFFKDWFFKTINGNTARYEKQKWEYTRQALEQRLDTLLRSTAMSIAVTTVISLGISITVIRKNRRKKIIELRRQISSDLHDDVGALLGCSMLAARHLEETLSNETDILKVRRIIDSTTKAIQAMRDIVWVSSDNQDSARQLAEKLEETLEIYSGKYEVSCKHDHLLNLADYRLQFSEKRDLLLFIKEALHNIDKHANATRINLQITVKQNRLKIIITDDGCGFDFRQAPGQTTGQGLISMRERANHMRGIFTIKTSPGNGTEITLELPVKKKPSPLKPRETTNESN
ncbi:hypothetical protein EGM51_12020 [Verrucomicrobia bacterium S94]|nr:hypothetical protein EGM51_12020 [Verrucomicrobia bacterium S94]